MQVIVADAASLPFDDGVADLAVAFMSLHDVDDMPAAVGEMSRVLGPGGVLCLAIVHPINSAGQFNGRKEDARFTIDGFTTESAGCGCRSSSTSAPANARLKKIQPIGQERPSPGGSAMRVMDVVNEAKGAMRASAVFGEPFEKDGITIIPAATIRGGAGGGGNEGDPQAGGVGFGVYSRPVGAFVIKGGEVTWQPALDLNRVIMLAIAVLLTVRTIVKAMAKGR